VISNFDFLAERWPLLASLGSLAERYLYSDSNTCFLKLGLLGETIVKYMLAFDKIDEPDSENTHLNRIKLLKRNGLIPKDIDDILYALRIARNDAVHEAYESAEKAQTLLELAYKLCAWFMQCYGEWSYEPMPFVIPEKEITNTVELENINKFQEDRIKELTQQLEILKSSVTVTDFESRRLKTAKAAEKLDLSEKETRFIIDEQLRQVGWEADSQELKYSKGTRPQKGKNIAIAEWPTDSQILASGAVDYALFKGLQLIGLIEAKRSYIDIPSVIDYQCKDYAKNIKAEHDPYVISKWNDYKVPFLYATNGRKYLKQLETKSGIWFLDARKPSNIPYALTGWPSPQGLGEELEKDINQANETLHKTSLDLLEDPAGLNLRPYQMEAVKTVEAEIIAGKKTLLVAMATGTGKTRTILGIIYRLIKAERFKRVLFLVDRTSLGEQAEDTFKDVKIEDLMTIDQIYDLKNLEETGFDSETKIHIATVQGLVKRIMYNDSEVIPAVTDYDLIIIDEAHRGYILDKEMGDDELLYRDQTDFISKYRTIIEYFDAVKIALTATPALHTTEIFGKPVFNYSYREAVIEGYLIDHDAPHILNTKLKMEGINYQAGETVAIYDPTTGEITNSEELADEPKDKLDLLENILYRQWNIFNVEPSSIYKIVKNICHEKYEEQPELFDSPVGILQSQDKDYLDDNLIIRDYSWKEFVEAIKRKNRFHTDYMNKEVLDKFIEYVIKTYKAGAVFYRGRISANDGGWPINEMGAPPVDRVLYLADTVNTTLHEIRAGVYDYVTIGDFVLQKDISVVNLADIDKISPFIFFDYTLHAINKEYLQMINQEIAKPLRRHDSRLDYLPTQYLTEYIKSQGFDGIEYISTMGGDGYNLAIFNEKLFECVSTTVYDVKSVLYSCDEIK